jgi:hypothetical protein
VAALRSAVDDDQTETDVRDAFLALDLGDIHLHAEPHYEHDQWWVSCSACGAQWSVVDVEKDGEDGFDFEEVSHGDDHCADNHKEEE